MPTPRKVQTKQPSTLHQVWPNSQHPSSPAPWQVLPNVSRRPLSVPVNT